MALSDLLRPLRSVLPRQLTPANSLAGQGAAVGLTGLLGTFCLVAVVTLADSAAIQVLGIASLLAWAAGALSFWVAWWLAMRGLRNGRVARRHNREQLVVALDSIRLHGAVESAADWGPDLQDAVHRLDREYRSLERTIADERRQGAFVRDLADALDIADTESEVFRTAARAAGIQIPLTDFQLLVAEADLGGIQSVVDNGVQACSCPRSSACPALRKGRALHFRPGTGLARCPQLRDEESHAICAPISAAAQTIAVAQVSWRGGERPEIQESVNALAYALGARLGVVRTLEEREMQASTDPLTGLANRRAMNLTLSGLSVAGGAYAIIACDLDNFKKLNDSYGHEAGDRCLKLFAGVLNEVCRASDLPCRPGGEEFTVVLTEATSEVAVMVAERIRSRLAHASRAAGRPFTVSMGVAASPMHGMSHEEILHLADQALYKAKEGGRDRVCEVVVPGQELAA